MAPRPAHDASWSTIASGVPLRSAASNCAGDTAPRRSSSSRWRPHTVVSVTERSSVPGSRPMALQAAPTRSNAAARGVEALERWHVELVGEPSCNRRCAPPAISADDDGWVWFLYRFREPRARLDAVVTAGEGELLAEELTIVPSRIRCVSRASAPSVTHESVGPGSPGAPKPR